eukprot:TRINITY_DN1186_c0_g1_i3.p1 TRINITY_DN1186_c0_g1~~TRINITY_DN1186_c0_g1_i3.p1  ORF type:complete len:1505 (+),score=344.76 TRINITY_DN1186_c0_g1_i3:118-4632(+)
MSTLENQFLLGYDGSKAALLSDTEIAHTLGNNLVITDLKNESRRSFVVDQYPVGVVAVNPKQTMMVIGERREQSGIFIHSLPDMTRLQHIQNVGNTEISDAVFSRDGQFLAVLAGLPEFSLALFNVNPATRGVSPCCRFNATISQPRKITFSPFTADDIVTTGNNYIMFWRVERIQGAVSLSHIEGKAAVKLTCSCHTSVNGEVLAGTTTGDIYQFDVNTGSSTPWWESPGGGNNAVSALVFSRHHVIAASCDSIVKFYRHDNKVIERTIALASSKITHMLVGQKWNNFYVLGSDGIIESIVLPGYEQVNLRTDAFRDIPNKGGPIADFSGGPFTGACHLDTQNCAVTVGTDDTLRVWKYDENILMSKVSSGRKPTCICTGTGATSDVVVVGYATAHIRFFDLTDCRHPKIIGQELLLKEGIAHVVTPSPSGKAFAISFSVANAVSSSNPIFQAAAASGGSTVSSTIFIIEGVRTFTVSRRLTLDVDITDVVWTSATSLLMSSENGDIRLVNLSEHTPSSEDELNEMPKSVITHLWRLDLPALKFALSPETDGTGDDTAFVIAALSRDKTIKLYSLDKGAKHTDTAKIAIKKPHCQFKLGDRLGQQILLVDNKLYTASSDGKVEIRDFKGRSGDRPRASCCRHSCMYGGIAGLCVSSDRKWLITAGGDGCIAVWSLAPVGPEVCETPFRIIDQSELVEVNDETVTYVIKAEEERKRLVQTQYASVREATIKQIDGLRQRLQLYKEENTNAKPEEKLETQAFMIESQREEIEELGKQQMLDKEEEIKWSNLTKNYIADNIKKQCWDSMQTHLLILKGLNPNKPETAQVPNYNIQKVPQKEKVLLRKVKFLREVERLEWERRNDFVNLEDLVAAPEGENDEAPTSPNKEQTPSEDASPLDEETEEVELSVDEESLLPVDNHLYSRFVTYTRSRTITQMLLLQQQILVKRIAFNKLVVEAHDRKKLDKQKILEKNIRIKQILKELDQPEDMLIPQDAPSEDPSRVLVVKNEEIQVEQFTEQGADGEGGEEKRGDKEDDSNERALKAMMDNRLERDERVVIEITVPPFADKDNKDWKPADEWSDEEVRQYKEYEKKIQKRIDEEEKHRRALQQELKEVQKDVDTIVSSFDQHLQSLFNKKLDTDTELCQIDLQIIKLAQGRIQQEEMEAHNKKLTKIVEAVSNETSKAVQLANDSQRELQLKRDKYDELLNNERKKSGDKEIRTQLPFSECEDYCDILIKLLRKSTKPKKEKTRKEKDGKRKKDEPASPDPFAFVEEEEEEKKKRVHQQPELADVKLDKPEGLRDDTWRDFLEFRRERLESEREQKLLFDELQEMTKANDRLQKEAKSHQANLDDKLRMVRDFQTQVIRERYNLDILHTFKQGKIEVEQEAVVTDYADAILIHKKNIEDLNAQIREHGRAKVDKMMEIMQFKKGIRLIEWENQMLNHDVISYEMQHKHLHTLRVTKAMQEFIKGGAENHHDLERSAIMKKIEHVRTTMQAKIEENRTC